jgi:hypothetical protein
MTSHVSAECAVRFRLTRRLASLLVVDRRHLEQRVDLPIVDRQQRLQLVRVCTQHQNKTFSMTASICPAPENTTHHDS